MTPSDLRPGQRRALEWLPDTWRPVDLASPRLWPELWQLTQAGHAERQLRGNTEWTRITPSGLALKQQLGTVSVHYRAKLGKEGGLPHGGAQEGEGG